ncbi:MAG: hypothetical protein EOP06_00565 [Proteobacteria bacterium]|nr:MAG: hypothetical protein EOP06_00565 [Pseudomonadota bacterium]
MATPGNARVSDFRLYHAAGQYDIPRPVNIVEIEGGANIVAGADAKQTNRRTLDAVGALSLTSDSAAKKLVGFLSTASMALVGDAAGLRKAGVVSSAAVSLIGDGAEFRKAGVTASPSLALVGDGSALKRVGMAANPSFNLSLDATSARGLFLSAIASVTNSVVGQPVTKIGLSSNANIGFTASGDDVRFQFVVADVGLGVSGIQDTSVVLETISGNAVTTITVAGTLTKRTAVTNVNGLGQSTAVIVLGGSLTGGRRRPVRTRDGVWIRMAASGTESVKASLSGQGGIVVSTSAKSLQKKQIQAVGTVTLQATAAQLKKLGMKANPTLQVVSVADAKKIMTAGAGSIVGIEVGQVTNVRRRLVKSSPTLSVSATGKDNLRVSLQTSAGVSINASGYDIVRRFLAASPSIGNAAVSTQIARIAHLMGYADLSITVDAGKPVRRVKVGGEGKVAINANGKLKNIKTLAADASVGVAASLSGQPVSVKDMSAEASITIHAEGRATLRVFAKAGVSIGLLAKAMMVTGYVATVVDDFTLYLEWVEDDVIELEAVYDSLMLLKAIEDI